LDKSSTVAQLPKRVTVIGFGLMGAQISQVFALAGFEVTAYDINSDLLARGLDLINNGKFGLRASVEKSRISQSEVDRVISRISTTDSLKKGLDHAQFVLEAVVEDLKTKQSVLKKASSLSEKTALLASNTSTLSLTAIGKVLSARDRSRLVGMHFFNPPQVMKLIEIIRTKKTSPETISKLQAISRLLGKVSILVLDRPGFVANRIGISVFAEASDLLESGTASVRDIDLAMRLGYGYPMGPFELGDLVGLDARLKNMNSLYSQTKDKRFRPPKLLRKLVAEDYLGDRSLKPESKGGYYEDFGLKRPSEEKS
jgi:3-hydroxybutyryl-CoA dehydrogenase